MIVEERGVGLTWFLGIVFGEGFYSATMASSPLAREESE